MGSGREVRRPGSLRQPSSSRGTSVAAGEEGQNESIDTRDGWARADLAKGAPPATASGQWTFRFCGAGAGLGGCGVQFPGWRGGKPGPDGGDQPGDPSNGRRVGSGFGSTPRIGGGFSPSLPDGFCTWANRF